MFQLILWKEAEKTQQFWKKTSVMGSVHGKGLGWRILENLHKKSLVYQHLGLQYMGHNL